MTRNNNINVRVSDSEKKVLTDYCHSKDITQTQVIRFLIRTLEGKCDSSLYREEGSLTDSPQTPLP